MEEDVGGAAARLGKDGEVDLKSKSGTAWSHNFLNQKPWHPLSYPNQRRKWIAEQTHANHARRQEEVAREFAQEQHFFRQTALFNKKEKEKMEMMKAVSFMYVRPPGYNPESAKAAEISDQTKSTTAPSTSSKDPDPDSQNKNNKAARPKDVYGRALPTENEFEALKNAPKLDTGVAGRSKPFAVEIRNVRCVRCGTFGHQSGDRECPLKDKIMPNDETRLKRDDPLNAILAQTDLNEPLKWELKQKPGISPPRGGFNPDDPNQQILPDHDIFDQYGGFLSGGEIPALLTSFSPEKLKRKKSKHSVSSSKRKHKKHKENNGSSDSESERENKKERSKSRHKKYSSSSSSSSSSSEDEVLHKSRRKKREPTESPESKEERKSKTRRNKNKHKETHSHDDHKSRQRQRRY